AATAEYAKFVKELAAREQKLADFLESKRRDLREGARKRAGEYLLAIQNSRDVPDAQEFMLIAEGNDLNPSMISRWRAQLRRSVKTAEPVFSLWHRFSELPEKDFAARAAALLAGKPERPVNPLVWKAFTARPPQTMAEVCRRYGELLGEVNREWQVLLSLLKGAPSALPDAEKEQLRLALYGLDAAANVLPGQ